MAIVRKYGRPSLFVTFTPDPKFPKITRELLPGQDASDRPDLIARVFYFKVEALLHEVKHDNIFS